MKVSKIYMMLLAFLLTLSSIVSAEYMEIKERGAVEVKPLITARDSRQVLYSLLVMEIAADNVKGLGLSEIKVSQKNEERKLNLIYQDDFLQIIKDNWELVLNKSEDKSKSMVISSPQIVVVPGHTGYLSVGQEEIVFDSSGNGRMVTFENTLELEITPERAFRSDRILTRIKMNAGTGETGLETEAWISPDNPQLLGIVTSSDKRKERRLNQTGQESNNRYFALYLTAQPTGIITFPAFSGSLNGLENLFESKKNKIDKKYIGVSFWMGEYNKGVNLSGGFQNKPDLKSNFDFNQILSGENSVEVMGQVYDGLWFGGEIIYGDENGFSTAVKIVDYVKLGPVKLAVGISPFVYSCDREEKSSRYFLSSETSLNENLKLILGYHSQGKSDYTKVRLDYQLNSANSILMGYMIGENEENDNKDNRGYWLGFRFKL